MFGDNTGAATKVVHAFDSAFKDSKLSPAAIQEVVKDMTSGILGMDTATKAFISSQSGGRGGLAGSFEIDLALQEGKMDQVLAKTMDTIKGKMGGQILTLEDVRDNQALAGQFQKQLSYMTDVAHIAKSQSEAEQLSKAWKTGAMDKLKTETTEDSGKKALDTAVTRGGEEQQRTNSIFMTANQTLEKSKLIQANIFSGMMEGFGRLSFGSTAATMTAQHCHAFTGERFIH